MIQQQVPLGCQSVCLHPAWLATTLKSVILNAAATFHAFTFRQAFVFFQSVLYHKIKHLDFSIPKNIKKLQMIYKNGFGPQDYLVAVK